MFSFFFFFFLPNIIPVHIKTWCIFNFWATFPGGSTLYKHFFWRNTFPVLCTLLTNHFNFWPNKICNWIELVKLEASKNFTKIHYLAWKGSRQTICQQKKLFNKVYWFLLQSFWWRYTLRILSVNPVLATVTLALRLLPSEVTKKETTWQMKNIDLNIWTFLGEEEEVWQVFVCLHVREPPSLIECIHVAENMIFQFPFSEKNWSVANHIFIRFRHFLLKMFRQFLSTQTFAAKFWWKHEWEQSFISSVFTFHAF